MPRIRRTEANHDKIVPLSIPEVQLAVVRSIRRDTIDEEAAHMAMKGYQLLLQGSLKNSQSETTRTMDSTGGFHQNVMRGVAEIFGIEADGSRENQIVRYAFTSDEEEDEFAYKILDELAPPLKKAKHVQENSVFQTSRQDAGQPALEPSKSATTEEDVPTADAGPTENGDHLVKEGYLKSAEGAALASQDLHGDATSKDVPVSIEGSPRKAPFNRYRKPSKRQQEVSGINKICERSLKGSSYTPGSKDDLLQQCSIPDDVQAKERVTFEKTSLKPPFQNNLNGITESDRSPEREKMHESVNASAAVATLEEVPAMFERDASPNGRDQSSNESVSKKGIHTRTENNKPTQETQAVVDSGNPISRIQTNSSDSHSAPEVPPDSGNQDEKAPEASERVSEELDRQDGAEPLSNNPGDNCEDVTSKTEVLVPTDDTIPTPEVPGKEQDNETSRSSEPRSPSKPDEVVSMAETLNQSSDLCLFMRFKIVQELETRLLPGTWMYRHKKFGNLDYLSPEKSEDYFFMRQTFDPDGKGDYAEGLWQLVLIRNLSTLCDIMHKEDHIDPTYFATNASIYFFDSASVGVQNSALIAVRNIINGTLRLSYQEHNRNSTVTRKKVDRIKTLVDLALGHVILLQMPKQPKDAKSGVHLLANIQFLTIKKNLCNLTRNQLQVKHAVAKLFNFGTAKKRAMKSVRITVCDVSHAYDESYVEPLLVLF